MPGTPRKGGAGFVVNGQVYYGSGIDNNNVRQNDFWEYNPATGINDPVVISEISCYPKPANDTFWIQSSSEKINALRIYDKNLKLIFSINAHSQQIKLNLDNFVSGIYFCRISLQDIELVEKMVILKN